MSDPATYKLRLPERRALVIWLVWLAVAVALAAGPLARHFTYARQGHPNLFWVFVAALIGAAFLLPPAYQLLRRRGWWRREPLLLAGFPLAACLAMEPRATLVILWFAFSANGVGKLVNTKLGCVPASRPAALVLDFATGFGILFWPLVLLGHFQLLRPWPLLGLLALATVVWVGRIPCPFRNLAALYRRWGETPALARLGGATFVVMAGVLIAAGLAVALAPSIAFDPLRFHLPLAKYYAATGAIHPMPSDGYGYNPQNFEMLLGAGWVLAGQAAAQLVTPLFFVLFLAALFAVGRAAGLSRANAVIASGFAAAVPYIHWTGVNVKHDVPVALFQLAGLLAYLTWRRTGEFRWIYLGVFFAATSFGFKHPAAFGILGLAALYIPAAWRQPRRWRAFFWCGLIFLTLGAFWQVRSWVLTGDPFFYYNLSQPLPAEHAAQVGSLTQRLLTGLTWPWRVHFDGGLFFRSATVNPMGILLVVFAPLWLLLRRRWASPEARACLVFAAVSLVPWSLYVPLLRFVIAPISLLVLFTVDRALGWQRASVRLAAAFTLLFSFCVILILEVNAPQFRYFTRQLDRRGYLSEALLTYRSLDALSRYAGPHDRVLSIWNCSMAYAPYPDQFYCTYFDPENPTHLATIRRDVRDPSFRFVILPTERRWLAILDRAAGGRPRTPLYTGEHYSLYRLEPE